MIQAKPDPLHQIIGTRLEGGYQVEQRIGSGGMGSVYSARHMDTKHRVAVKVLAPEYATDTRFVERLFLEAQAVNIINHQGLVRIYSCGYLDLPSLGNVPYLVMELLQGESLFDRLHRTWKNGGLTSITEILRIGRQTADALAAVHAQNIVHRDLKPENLFLVPDPEVQGGERIRILDFGVAKFHEAHLVSRRTTADRVMGTPHYMSPEQCRGALLTGRSDVYALGVVLYEMVTGHLPFHDDDPVSVMTKHLRDPVPSLASQRPQTPPEVAELIERMLGKEVDSRPTMVEVATRLEELASLEFKPTSQVPLHPSTSVLKPLPLFPYRSVVGGIALLGVALGLLLLLRPSPRPPNLNPNPDPPQKAVHSMDLRIPELEVEVPQRSITQEPSPPAQPKARRKQGHKEVALEKKSDSQSGPLLKKSPGQKLPYVPIGRRHVTLPEVGNLSEVEPK